MDTDRIDGRPGHLNDNNYNQIDSPGTNYRKQDGE